MRVTSGEDVTVELEGAHVTIPSETVAAMWLDRLRNEPVPLASGLPVIGATCLGGTFMGIVRGENGGRDQPVIDLGEAPTRMNFAAAQKWATEKGGRLPTRREQSLMFANRAGGQYQSAYYWSCEQYEGGADCAWFQNFGDGTQGYGHKGHECHVRAVRLVDPSMIR